LLWESIFKITTPVSTALPLTPFEGIVPVICSNTITELHDSSGLVHWCVHATTQAALRQQERAYTLQVTALEFRSVLKLQGVRERHCKMCPSRLHAHAFPLMLQIPALNHTTSFYARIHLLCSFLRLMNPPKKKFNINQWLTNKKWEQTKKITTRKGSDWVYPKQAWGRLWSSSPGQFLGS